MLKNFNSIKLLLSSGLTGIIYLLGGYDVALQVFLVVMLLDYITGILSAIYNKSLSSKVGLKGILKKVSYLCVVALGFEIDNLTGSSGVVRNLIVYFFVGNDGLSIIENLAEMNVALPKKLIDVLEQLKGSDKNGSEESV